jgi:hypothetical protein
MTSPFEPIAAIRVTCGVFFHGIAGIGCDGRAASVEFADFGDWLPVIIQMNT